MSKPKSTHSEKHVHASIGFKKKLGEILASKNTLASLADTSGSNPKKGSPSKSNKREQPTAKNRAKAVQKGMIPKHASKQRMPEVNKKKERVIHPNQVKDIAKKKLLLKSEGTLVNVNPAGAKYHYNKQKGWHPNPNLSSAGKTKVSSPAPKSNPNKTGISGNKIGGSQKNAAPGKFHNPLAPHKMENGSTLFSMFDKPTEYKAIRSGKQFVKPAVVPEASEGYAAKKVLTPKKSGTKVIKPTGGSKVDAPKKSTGGSSGGMKPPSGSNSGITPPKGGGHYEIPAHPTHRLEAYSPLKHFSNMFASPVTAHAGAAARGAVGQRQIFRPQSLVMRKSLSELGIKEKSFKQHLAGVLAAGAMHTGAMTMPSQPKTEVAQEQLNKNPAPKFIASHDKAQTLKAISRVESSGGTNLNHPEIKSGLNKGTHAIGKYALTSLLVRELATKDHSLKSTYGHLANASDDEIKENFAKNPSVEEEFASKQYDHISHALNSKDARLIGHAWNNGISGTLKAMQSGKDINNHPYVKKITAAYNGK